MENPGINAIEKKDPELSSKGLQLAGKAYAGDLSNKDYRVSPIYGNFDRLPAISIFISTHDIFYADAEKLRLQFEEQRLPLNYFVYPKLFHDWCLATTLSETKATLEQVKNLL